MFVTDFTLQARSGTDTSTSTRENEVNEVDLFIKFRYVKVRLLNSSHKLIFIEEI